LRAQLAGKHLTVGVQNLEPVQVAVFHGFLHLMPQLKLYGIRIRVGLIGMQGKGQFPAQRGKAGVFAF
jgi:hypothetical protein